MNISLPETLKTFVDAQFSQRDDGINNKKVRELIRKDQDRLQLHEKLQAGGRSAPSTPVDGTYFQNLRERVHRVTFRITAQ